MQESTERIDSLDPRHYSDNLDQILAQLYNLRAKRSGDWFSAVEIARELRDQYGLHIHWRTIDALLARNLDYVARRKRQNRWEYRLLVDGEERVQSVSHQILLVDPAEALQAVIGLHDLLSGLKGTIAICDPYFDVATVEHLEACPKAQVVRILTRNVRDSGRLRRLLHAATSSGYIFEIRISSKDDIHDRYIIDESGMVILGASLNGFGRKQCFVIRAGEDFRAAMLSDFNRRWEAASPWP